MSNIPTVIFIQKPNNFETKYLIGNPDITFFKSVYRRYTNFSKFTTSILPLTEQDNTLNKYKISNFAGDLLSKVYFENTINFNNASCVIYNNLGTSSFKEINLKFNGDTIFKNDNLYLEAKSELINDIVFSHNGSYTISPHLRKNGSNIVCVNGNKYQNTTLSGGVGGMKLNNETLVANFFIIPDFSFMKDYGLSIPLLCLNNTDIFLEYTYNNNNISNKTSGTITFSQKCIVEYINLDIAEKKRFKLNDHEYIIEDTRIDPYNISFNDSRMVVNINESNTVLKQLLFIGCDNTLTKGTNRFNTPVSINNKYNFKLTLDNELFLDDINTNTLTRYNTYQHYKGSGRDIYNACQTLPVKDHGLIDSIGIISFCLYPNNYTQPSGSISISNNRNLSINTTNSTTTNKNSVNNIIVYKISYNLLKFSNGQYQFNIS